MPVGQHNFHLFYTQTLISNIMELIIRECVVMRSENLKIFSLRYKEDILLYVYSKKQVSKCT